MMHLNAVAKLVLQSKLFLLVFWYLEVLLL